MNFDNNSYITPNTWIISDTHFFHENIGRYCNRPDNWQELIINNWNSLISSDEAVLHLGDFSLGKKVNFEEIASVLNGNIVLIQGNHDRISKSYCEQQGIILVKKPIKLELSEDIKIIFSHYPIDPLEDGWINLHGHIHNNINSSESSFLGPNHINMSIEVREYRPWRLSEILANRTD